MLGQKPVPTSHQAFATAEGEVRDGTNRLLAAKGSRTVDWFHRELGKIVWDECGMARSDAGLRKAMAEIPALEEEFHRDVRILGSAEDVNQALERAGRVADFFELAKLMCRDALDREESCGGHFRVEHQSDDGEAKRNDADYAYVAAWGYGGPGGDPSLSKEPLVFENAEVKTRSYA